MALLWCDGFDHYGTDENNMLDGVYAECTSNVALNSSIVATGTHSVSFLSVAYGNGIRKVLPAATSKMGAMARFYLPSLPDVNTCANIFRFLTTSPFRAQLAVMVDLNGCLRFYRGGYFESVGTTAGALIATSDPIIVASAWNHIEIQVYIHDTEGWVRAAVNGVHRFEATGLDTQYDTSEITSISTNQQAYSGPQGDNDFYMDDLIVYDFTGSSAVDTDFCPAVDGGGVATNYIGELQCMYLPPNGDTAQMDWVASTGTDEYAMIDETTPNDADYISSTTAADLSEFDLTDLPEDITYIRGLQLLGRMSKSDSGTAMTKFGMKSDISTDDADERPVTVEPTYWWDFMNVDPDSSARWTRDSLNAAWFRLTRSV